MSNTDIDELKLMWSQVPDKHVLKAATENLAEYSRQAQQVITEEAEKRNLIKRDSRNTIDQKKAWGLSSKKYKSGSGASIRLAGWPSISSSEEGFILKGKYDPPGTVWLALLSTIIMAVLLYTLAVAGTYMSGPGFIIWYFIIRSMRRCDINKDLQNVTNIIFDDEDRSVDMLLLFKGKSSWLSFKVREDYEGLVKAFSLFFKHCCRHK